MAPLLEVSNVSIHFGGVQALDHASLTVDADSIVGLIGPNGAGKTTMFNIISGLLRPDSGSVRFDGAELADRPAHTRVHAGIGRSFQNLGLVGDETAESNVLVALHQDAHYSVADVVGRPWRWRREETRLRERALRSLARFGLEDVAGELVSDLSFGRARFVELAAVAATEPRLLLLDEPTTGLDIAEIARLRQVLLELRASGATVLVVAHDVRFVMGTCDHVYVLAEGRVICDGSPRVVQAHPAVVEAYLGRTA